MHARRVRVCLLLLGAWAAAEMAEEMIRQMMRPQARAAARIEPTLQRHACCLRGRHCTASVGQAPRAQSRASSLLVQSSMTAQGQQSADDYSPKRLAGSLPRPRIRAEPRSPEGCPQHDFATEFWRRSQAPLARCPQLLQRQLHRHDHLVLRIPPLAAAHEWACSPGTRSALACRSTSPAP